MIKQEAINLGALDTKNNLLTRNGGNQPTVDTLEDQTPIILNPGSVKALISKT